MTCKTDTPLFPCPQCGTPTEFKFGMGHYYPRKCDPCAAAALRERNRKVAEARRRARGVAPVKGTEWTCSSCRATFIRNSLRNVRCKPCQKRFVLDTQSATIKERRKSDPAFALNSLMSSGIRGSLRAGKGGFTWEALVGYSLDDLMRHLERQFLPGMTWENRGSWHVDHRVPLCSFDFSGPDDPAFAAAWAITNLQPLWAKDNLVKNGSRIYLL